jgi:hypothetical protein
MDFPQTYQATPTHITTFSAYSGVYTQAAHQGVLNLGTNNWPAINRAFFVPISLPFNYLVRRMFWINGSAIGTQTRDIGIYTGDGTRLYSSGNTTASGASTAQYVTLGTPLLLTPDRYYLALANSSITINQGVQGSNTAAANTKHLSGVMRQSSAQPLPSSMDIGGTLAADTALVPFIGITWTDSGF